MTLPPPRTGLSILLLLFALNTAAQAEPRQAQPGTAEPPPTAELTAAPDPPPVLPGDRLLSGSHAYLSRSVEDLARRIDAFFGTEQAFDESSGTYIQARGSVIYRKGGNVDFDARLRAKLDLPNLKRRLSLVIESEPEELGGQQGERLTTGSESVRESLDSKDVSASLQYVLRERPTWDLRLQPGIKLHWPPETFIRLRSRRIHPLSENWLSRVTLTPGWFDSRGWEVRLKHDFDRDAGRASLFRIASEATWLVKEDRNVELVQSLAYSHALSSRVRMGYETGVIFETEPTFWDTTYFSSITYRRNIHRGWMFFELKPQLLSERDNHFKANPSIAMTLEVLFGVRTLAPRPH